MTINNIARLPVISDLAGIYFVKNNETPEINGIYVKAYDNVEAEPMIPTKGTNYLRVSSKGTYTANGIELQSALAYAKAKTDKSATNKFTIIVPPGLHYTDLVIENTVYVSEKTSSIVILNEVLIDDNEGIWEYGIQSNESSFAEQGVLVGHHIQYFNGIGDDSGEQIINRIENGIAYVRTYENNTIYAGQIFDSWNTSPYAFSYKDAEHINILSLTGECDVQVKSISLLADKVHIKGFECLNTRFALGDNLANIIVEKCKSIQTKAFSIGNHNINNLVSGTFIDCIGYDGSFADAENAIGTFIRCTANQSSFGDYGIASGIFIDCVAGYKSFGGALNPVTGVGIATGTFIRCTAKPYSAELNLSKAFGRSISDGYYEDCKGAGESFAGNSNVSNNSGNCEAKGIYINCIAGHTSFGGYVDGVTVGGYPAVGKFSGKATNCTAGYNSFGKTLMIGKLRNCIIDADTVVAPQVNTFTIPTGTGKVANCIDGTYAIKNL